MRPILLHLCVIGLAMVLPQISGSGADGNDIAKQQAIQRLVVLEDRINELRQATRLEEAEATAKQAVDLARGVLGEESEFFGIALGDLAGVYRDQSRYVEAEPLLLGSLAIREKAIGKDHPEIALALDDLGQLYREMARYDEAESLHLRALKLKEAGRLKPELIGQSLTHLGLLYDDQGKFAKAEQLHQRALAIDEGVFGKDRWEVAIDLVNLANAITQQGRFAEAEPLYQRALAIAEREFGQHHPRLAQLLGNLGNLYRDQARYNDSDPIYRRALQIYERHFGKDHLEVALPLGNLATSYLFRADYEKAVPLQERALAINERVIGKEHPKLSDCLNNLAISYVGLERFGEAEELYKRAIVIQEKAFGKADLNLARTFGNLANLYEKQEDFAKAEPLYNRSVEILSQDDGEVDRRYKAFWGRARVRWAVQRQDAAIADLRRALAIVERSRKNSSGGESERAQAFGRFEQVFEQMFDWQRQLGNLSEAMNAAERWRARSLVDQINLQGVDLLAGLPAEEARELRERDDRATSRVAATEKLLAQLPGRKDLDDERKAAERQRLLAELDAARAEAVEAYRAIRNASKVYRLMIGKDFKPIELETLQKWVRGQQGVFLQYFIGYERGYLLVAPCDGESQIISLDIPGAVAKEIGVEAGPLTLPKLFKVLAIDGKPLAEVLKQPESRAGKLAAAVDERMALLWRLLLPEDMRQALVGGTYKKLIVVPDGGLVNLPFDALVVERKEGEVKYLLDVGPPIVSGPSATLLYNLATRQQSMKGADDRAVLSVGDPAYAAPQSPESGGSALDQLTPRARSASYRGQLKPLPFSGWEAGWVADQFNPVGLTTTKLTRAAATERAVRTNLAGRQIVHLACHGLTDQTHGNLFGALALAPGQAGSQEPADDGLLTLAEIYNLEMNDCELAILSACETNLGPQQQGEGVFALSRGFLVAGARRVVASNWIVDDRSSASLISIFCSLLAKQHKTGEPMDYAAALHEAKRWVRKQEKWKHPYYWGAFVLVGPG